MTQPDETLSPAPRPNPPAPDPTHQPTPDVASLADGQWHRVHPLSPVLKSGAVLIAALGLGISRLEDALRSSLNDAASGEHSHGGDPHTGRWLIAGAILLGVVALLLVTNWLAWRKNEFRIDDDSLHVRRGLIGKQQRKARFDRVQAIDVNQPLFPRLLGLAQLTFDVAGGRESKIAIHYVRRDQAEGLRALMLDRVRVSRETHGVVAPATLRSDGAPQAGADPEQPGSDLSDHAAAVEREHDAAAAFRPGAPIGSRIVHGIVPSVVEDLNGTLTEALAPYRVQVRADAQGSIVRVPPHRVLMAQLMTAGPMFSALVLVALVVLVIVGVATDHARDALSIAVTVLFMVFGFMHVAVRTFLRDANFSVALTGDGVVVTHGLTSTTRRLIPVDRIQAVELSQPWLWRRFGWWRVRMNLASGAVLGDDASSLLLPVGSIDDAMMLMGLVLPEPGTPTGIGGRGLMEEAMTAARTTASTPAAALFTGTGRRAGLFDPLTARREAWARTATMTVIREGRLVRRVICVPHARVQSMALTQGPLQRRLGLATIELHSTSGPAKPTIVHQPQDVAHRFLFDHAEVTRRARAALDGV